MDVWEQVRNLRGQTLVSRTDHNHSHHHRHHMCTPTHNIAHNTTHNITRRQRDRERQSKKNETEREEKTKEKKTREKREDEREARFVPAKLGQVQFIFDFLQCILAGQQFYTSANYLFYAVTVFFFWLCSYSSEIFRYCTIVVGVVFVERRGGSGTCVWVSGCGNWQGCLLALGKVYHSARNQFERFRGFLELSSRFEFDFRRCGFFFGTSRIFGVFKSSMTCNDTVHTLVLWPVCAHTIQFQMLWCL